MPELPEVEVVRAGLQAHVPGRTIESVEVLHPRPLRRDPRGATGFIAAVRGQQIEAVRRRGKYFWLALTSGDAILGHLGMSGQMLLQQPGAPDERHLRVRFTLSALVEQGRGSGAALVEQGRGSGAALVEQGRGSGAALVEQGRSPVSKPSPPADLEMRFVDQRMFGGLLLSEGGVVAPAEITHIARDPLDPEFDEDEFVRRARRRTSGVKRLLLDQGLVSGVGNIYADEALWRAGIHGERSGARLTGPQLRGLLRHARTVMEEALAQGGTSFDDLYVNVNGESGYFERSLDAYGREGEPCRRCGTPIRRVHFMNRSSYFCPKCQPAPRARGVGRTVSA